MILVKDNIMINILKSPLWAIVNKYDKSILDYQSSSKNFLIFVTDVLERYLDDILSTHDLTNDISAYILQNEGEIKNRCKTIISGVIGSIRYYLEKSSIDGEAYRILKESLADSKLIQLLSNDQNKIAPRKGNFYRIRPSNSTLFTQEELFHIPFEKRELASTQRFSQPGFTHLYLANSIYTAWKELGNPDKISVIRFTNNFPIRFIDLDSTPFNLRKLTEESKPQSLVDYALLFPIILTSSLRVKNDSARFKVEYIIPQLLLECIRSTNPDIFGVRYLSTRIDTQSLMNTKFYNFVIPAREIRNTGHCSILKKAFSISSVLEIHEEIEDTGTYHYNNGDIEEVSILGNITQYSSTNFSRIEGELMSELCNNIGW